MWSSCSHTLDTLTNLTSNIVIFKWDETKKKFLKRLSGLWSRNNLLSYPCFKKLFEIHTDSGGIQLGFIISQEGKRIYVHIIKLNILQKTLYCDIKGTAKHNQIFERLSNYIIMSTI